MWQLLCILPFFSIITMTQKYRKGRHHWMVYIVSTGGATPTTSPINIPLNLLQYITLWYIEIHYNTSHYIVIHCNSLQYITFPNVKSHYIKFTYITHQRGNPINIPLSPLLFYLISRGDLKYALQNTNSHQTMTIVLNDFNVDCCHSKH